MMPKNPSVHPESDEFNAARKRPRWEKEKLFGKLQLASNEMKMGAPGAAERYQRCLEEIERLENG